MLATHRDGGQGRVHSLCCSWSSVPTSQILGCLEKLALKIYLEN